jgi:hypothetical protein
MNAGELHISVLADYSYFLRQLSDLQTVAKKDAEVIGTTVAKAVSGAVAEPKPVAKPIVKEIKETVRLIDPPLTELETKLRTRLKEAGATAGGAVGESMGQKLKNGLNEQMKGAIIAAIGVATADKLLKGFAEAIRGDKGLGKALEDVLVSVPVIGAAYQVGEAIGARALKGFESMMDPDRLSRRGTDIAYMEEVDARNKAEADAKAAGQRAAQELANRIAMERRHVAAQEKELSDRQDARAIAAAKYRKDEIAVYEIEYRRAIDALKAEELATLGPLVYDDEAWERANAVIKDRAKLLEEEFAERRAAIEEEATLREKALMDEAAKREEMAAAEEAKKDKEIQARMEALTREIEEIEDARTASARGGIGSAATAIGSFTFDAYPDAQKKANDERMISHLAGIHRRMETSGIN